MLLKSRTVERHRLMSVTMAAALPLSLAAVLPVGSAMAQGADITSCLGIAGVEARVACYDAIARAQQAAQVPAAPVGVRPVASAPAQAQAQAPAAATPQADFGFNAAERESRRPDLPRQLEEISPVVASVRVVGANYLLFTMRDGSVWQAEESRRAFRSPKAGDAVLVERGSLGAYYLTAGKQPRIRVKRTN
ncbi:MAG: hypothetical protein RLZZ08_1591 [Pseudomonadota bacterium]|jgi:hypothetical protein